MLYCELGSTKPEHFDDLAVFVAQLAALGADARIDIASLPAGLSRSSQFDVAGHLFESNLQAGDKVVLLGAQELDDVRLVQLRRAARRGATDCVAIGAFPSTQAIIGIRSKLSYVFGNDPEVINLGAMAGGELNPRCPVFGIDLRRIRGGSGSKRRRRLLLIAPDLTETAQARALRAMGTSRKMDVLVLTSGKAKAEWQKANGAGIPFYNYNEVPAAALATGVDLCVVLADIKSYRVQSLIANLAASKVPLFDGTEKHTLAKVNDAFIPSPGDLANLATYLNDEILPNLYSAGEKVRCSRFAQSIDPKVALGFIELSDSKAATFSSRAQCGAPETTPRAVFVPTNGVGLGHAQRCGQIACELDRAKVEPVFAAFPSCMKLLKSYGFDVMPMISRSPLHAEAHHNDLVNYSRLKTLSAGATSLIFDGGYVFDSIYRSIVENELTGVWIRRGLWQTEQDNSIALDREKVFSRVIVPAEVFEELNQNYSSGSHVQRVGPIVQRVEHLPAQRDKLRAGIAATFERDFERLAVTMLGGGIAANRDAQANAVCASMERRANTLHLLVVWPTATIDPAWFSWGNTRVVKTHHASALVAASDVYVSAVGYNSFHEVIYNRIPAIFMPQMNAFMDDQRARAQAAVDRGVACMVEPSQTMTLDRLLGEYLDDGLAEEIRSRLAGLNLPEPGNAATARMIEEITCG